MWGALRVLQGALEAIFTKAGHCDAFGGRLFEGKVYSKDADVTQVKRT